MKKLISFAIIALMASFIACGPSASEKAAEEQRIQDSITEAVRLDSIAQVEAAAAAVAAELQAAEAARLDSIAQAEAAAAAKKKPAAKKQTLDAAKKVEAPAPVKAPEGGRR